MAAKGKSNWYLPNELLERVARQAAKERRTQSTVVEKVLTDWLTEVESTNES